MGLLFKLDPIAPAPKSIGPEDEGTLKDLEKIIPFKERQKIKEKFQ